jgi:arylsulfatase A-like enzyme
MRKILLLLILASLAAALAPVGVDARKRGVHVVTTAPADAPDIVVVMADDLGAQPMATRLMPRLANMNDLFVQNGLWLAGAYSETPLCCPGRASFLSGQHTRRHGIVDNLHPGVFDPSNTIATALHDGGYRTALIGKYLNHAEKLYDKTPPGWDRVVMHAGTNAGSGGYWYVDGVRVESAQMGYADRATANESQAFVQGAPLDKPLFLYANPHAGHADSGMSKAGTPWLPAVEPQYANDPRCAGIEPWKMPGYDYDVRPDGFPLDAICRSLLTVDDMVGQLRTAMAIRELQTGRQTVWLFMADNGMSWGADGVSGKGVPQAGKLPLWFASTSASGTPLVMRGSAANLISNIDLAPTLAALAGTTMPRADGVSFAPMLNGSCADGGAGCGREWMLEDFPVPFITSGPWAGVAWWGVRKPIWHLVQRVGQSALLYDLRVDPWEQNDVHASHPNVTRNMKALADPLLP